MNRTILLLALFLILGIITVWYLAQESEERTTVAGWDRDFSVDPARISRIFIADRNGNQTNLERSGGQWVYNGQWRARPNAIDNLLDAVSRVQMKYKPPRAAVDNMIKNLATEGIKVEIFDQQGKKIKGYYVGGATPDERGTYLIMENADEPYVGHIPSWEGNLRFRFNLTGEDWRDKTVFAARMEEIQAVSIEYPQQKDKSFRLEKVGNRYSVKPFYPEMPETRRPYREGSAESFLLGFKSLVAEAFENDNPRRDSVSQLAPFSIIRLQKNTGEETTVRFYPIFVKYFEDNQLITSNNPDRYFAETSKGDFMLVQNRVFRSVFWGYDFFFE